MPKPKRKPALSADQLAFSFAPAPVPSSEGALAALERQTASAVAQILKDEPRDRYTVAAAVSRLLGDDVSKLMLDAYASEARDSHNISLARFLALIAATDRHDVLNALLNKIGCAVLVGEEVYLAEIGHLESQKRELEERLRMLKRGAQPLDRGGASK